MSDLHPTEILLSEGQIRQRVGELARDIQRDYPNGVHMVAVLKGAFVFLSDLVRHMDVPVSIGFVAMSSYGHATSSSGHPRLVTDLDGCIEDRDVVIVEDIVDGGLTLAALQETLRQQRPRTLRTACLLDKPARRQKPVRIEYVGFTIEDHFVVGYGLDYADRYRSLPHVAVLA